MGTYTASELCQREDNLSIQSVLALRLLFGFLTYFDNLGGPTSPIGNYKGFLSSLDDRVRLQITPANAFSFLDTVTATDPEAQRVVFILMDDFNEVQGAFPVRNELLRSWMSLDEGFQTTVLNTCCLRGERATCRSKC